MNIKMSMISQIYVFCYFSTLGVLHFVELNCNGGVFTCFLIASEYVMKYIISPAVSQFSGALIAIINTHCLL